MENASNNIFLIQFCEDYKMHKIHVAPCLGHSKGLDNRHKDVKVKYFSFSRSCQIEVSFQISFAGHPESPVHFLHPEKEGRLHTPLDTQSDTLPGPRLPC